MNPLINRRRFLGYTGTAIAAALGSTSLPLTASAADSARRSLKKAVHLDMIAGNASVLDKFKLAKEIGFDGLEINAPGDPRMEEIIKASETTGVQIADVIDSVHWKDTLSDANPDVRARGLEGLKEALRQCKASRCKTLLLVPGVVDKQTSYDEAYSRSQAEIRKAIPLAEELQVRIDIENVWNNFLLSPLEAARYVDELNSPWVGWHFDVGNIINYGFPEQWIHILGKRLGCIHVKEFSRSKRDKEGLWKGFDVELLEGDDDWPAVMKALDDVGYKGWMVAEIPGGDAERLKKIADRMEKIIAI